MFTVYRMNPMQPTFYLPFQKHYCQCGAQRAAKTGNIAVHIGLSEKGAFCNECSL